MLAMAQSRCAPSTSKASRWAAPITRPRPPEVPLDARSRVWTHAQSSTITLRSAAMRARVLCSPHRARRTALAPLFHALTPHASPASLPARALVHAARGVGRKLEGLYVPVEGDEVSEEGSEAPGVPEGGPVDLVGSTVYCQYYCQYNSTSVAGALPASSRAATGPAHPPLPRAPAAARVPARRAHRHRQRSRSCCSAATGGSLRARPGSSSHASRPVRVCAQGCGVRYLALRVLRVLRTAAYAACTTTIQRPRQGS